MLQKIKRILNLKIIHDPKTFQGVTDRGLRLSKILFMIALAMTVASMAMISADLLKPRSFSGLIGTFFFGSILLASYVVLTYDRMMRALLNTVKKYSQIDEIASLFRKRDVILRNLFMTTQEEIDEYEDMKERLLNLCSDPNVALAATSMNRDRLQHLKTVKNEQLLEIGKNLRMLKAAENELHEKLQTTQDKVASAQTAEILAEIFGEQEGLHEIFKRQIENNKGRETLN